MAEQEIIKHLKKSMNVLNSNEQSIVNKLKEFFLEIFIIVFAISLSIWFHSWEQHREEKHKVAEFLIDLQNDLTQDSIAFAEHSKFAKKFDSELTYVLGLSPRQLDSISKKKAEIPFTAPYSLRKTNNAIYESFKFSGNIGLIEDKNIKKQIISYYQSNVLELEELENVYNTKFLELASQDSYDNKNVEIFKNPKVRTNLGILQLLNKAKFQLYDSLMHDISKIKKVIKK